MAKTVESKGYKPAQENRRTLLERDSLVFKERRPPNRLKLPMLRMMSLAAIIAIFLLMCVVGSAFAEKNATHTGNITATGWKDLGNGWEEKEIDIGIKQPECKDAKDWAEKDRWVWCRNKKDPNHINKILWHEKDRDKLYIFIGSPNVTMKKFEIDVSKKQVKEAPLIPNDDVTCWYPSANDKYCLGRKNALEGRLENGTVMIFIPVFADNWPGPISFVQGFVANDVFWSYDNSKVYFMSFKIPGVNTITWDRKSDRTTKKLFFIREGVVNKVALVKDDIFFVTFVRGSVQDDTAEYEIYKTNISNLDDRISENNFHPTKIFTMSDGISAWHIKEALSFGTEGFTYVNRKGVLYFVDTKTMTKHPIKTFLYDETCMGESELEGPYFLCPVISHEKTIAVVENCKPSTINLYRAKLSKQENR